MLTKDLNQTHISVYNEIVNGKLFPGSAKFNDPGALRNLIFEVNLKTVTILPETENPKEYVDNNIFLSYGYKDEKDYTIEIKPFGCGKHEIIIKPRCHYDLREVIDIPQFVTQKCNSFVELMGDEYERIKIRAEWILEHGNEDKELSVYANKHVQKAKKIFYEAKQALRESQDEMNAENIYILFVLNIFIIKTILFYQKLFLPYLNLPPDSEEIMTHEVMKELSLRKICALFHCEKNSYGEYLKRSFIEKPGYMEFETYKKPVGVRETLREEQTLQEQQKTATYERIKVNGQINVLVDIFVQMLEEIEVAEGMFLETTRENLEAFLIANFKDKNGKAFSPYTINTLLKPYRTDKHIKKESPRRIDLSKRIKRI